ncbi:EAL domain-containing protein [Arthrobacter subterraneus]|uniref:EAL domain-containing protein n=1 Tax=Arthrobacter subterraneus TaxID=335973 RepID=UPI00381DFC5E
MNKSTGPGVSREDLLAACRGEGISSVYQPIIDTARGVVVGYEALIRFPGYEEKNPEAWLSAARRDGLAANLEAAALRSALTHKHTLPANCFLTVNTSPDLLTSPEIRAVWAAQDGLGGLVIEMTEQAPIDSYVALEPDLNALRAAGAVIAVDDAGSGYAGLQHLLSLKPAMIKIDRELVKNVHRDEAKRALIGMLGNFAGRIDAWILAEGVELVEELDALLSLGVPLVQGYLLGRPAAPWASLDDDLAHRMVSNRKPTQAVIVRDVLEAAVTVESPAAAMDAFAADPSRTEVVLVEGQHRPVAVLTPASASLAVFNQDLRVNLDTPILDALSRAVTREQYDRFAPLLVTDNAGRFAGVARMERLITALTG